MKKINYFIAILLVALTFSGFSCNKKSDTVTPSVTPKIDLVGNWEFESVNYNEITDTVTLNELYLYSTISLNFKEDGTVRVILSNGCDKITTYSILSNTSVGFFPYPYSKINVNWQTVLTNISINQSKLTFKVTDPNNVYFNLPDEYGTFTLIKK